MPEYIPGDILIVDRSLEPADKKVIIAVIDGELTVKRIRMIKECWILPSSPAKRVRLP